MSRFLKMVYKIKVVNSVFSLYFCLPADFSSYNFYSVPAYNKVCMPGDKTRAQKLEKEPQRMWKRDNDPKNFEFSCVRSLIHLSKRSYFGTQFDWNNFLLFSVLTVDVRWFHEKW